MTAWFSALTALQKAFALFAALGGGLFLIRLVLVFAGMGDHDTGAGDDLDVDDAHGGDAHHHADADLDFKLLSLQGLTAFFMVFGLVGLAMSRGSGFLAVPSVVVGLLAGGLVVFVLKKMFQGFGKLQHSGTLELKNAIGQEGTVYLTIPGNEPGKVNVVIQGRLQLFDALSQDQEKIETGARVKVIDLTNGNVLVVRRV